MSHPNSNQEDIFLPPRFTKPWTALMMGRRALYRNATNHPYLSCDSLAMLCDAIPFGLDGKEVPKMADLLEAKSFFVQADRLEDFERLGNASGLQPSVVVTGNSDRNFIDSRPNPLNSRLWLCQNNGMSPREGLKSLPIGLENKRLGRLGLEKWYKTPGKPSKGNRVMVPPMRPTNPHRAEQIRTALGLAAMFDVYTRYVQAPSYFRIIKNYRFVLCLEGNGLENHRIWECLYLGIFPVVISSQFTRNLAELDLPILEVACLEDVNEDLLNQFQVRNSSFSPANTPQLWIPHWEKLVRED